MLSEVGAVFTSTWQENTFQAALSELSQIGYRGELLQRQYTFRDWFSDDASIRVVPAAAFGQTPISYDTACAAVLLANGKSGVELVADVRALGAPLAFEVREREIISWRVSHTPSQDDKREVIGVEAISRAFREYSEQWSPTNLLRSKSIQKPSISPQLDFFDLGLIPALEAAVRNKLDPLLHDVMHTAVQTYRRTTQFDPDEYELFRLAFWLLAGKVFHDREIPSFAAYDADSDPDEVLRMVALHYGEAIETLLNRETRQSVYRRLWSTLDFRNLSVDVLTHIWSNTFVTEPLRKTLGIHSTPRTIGKYIVDHIPFEDISVDSRIVVEPCCGSSIFLVSALQRLRDLLPTSVGPQERHEYLKRMLIGYEKENFGIEISRLGLTLADFPNPNGWQLFHQDIYSSEHFVSVLRDARVVLCNPPFEDFPKDVRGRYQLRSVRQPAELLLRILTHLHPEGMLGFVVPFQFLDGRGYKKVREMLAHRFGQIELVSLPDRVFEHADQETVLLIATGPGRTTSQCLVAHRKVYSDGWEYFERSHRTQSESIALMSDDSAKASFNIPELSNIWSYLGGCPSFHKLGDIAKIARGIEWNVPFNGETTDSRNYVPLVRSGPQEGYREGFAPDSDSFYSFQSPRTKYLNMAKEYQRGNAHDLPWDRPKIILNAITKSRGRWRIAAFTDIKGLVAYQTFTCIWPTVPAQVVPLTAILNGPIANAFVASREGKRHIRKDTLKAIPVPMLSVDQVRTLHRLVRDYLSVMQAKDASDSDANDALSRIDAAVLESYSLPAKLERDLLSYFGGERRIVPFTFDWQYPEGLDFELSLHEYVHATLDWNDSNKRRTALIFKKQLTALSYEEAADLHELQRIAVFHRRLVAPLPLRELDELRKQLMGEDS